MYWQTMSGIQGHLLEAQTRAAALARLNTLTELGSAVGEMALESIDSLALESAGCALSGDLADALAEAPLCPGCGIRLDQQPPLEQAEQALARLDRAVERQISRLSSVAIRAVGAAATPASSASCASSKRRSSRRWPRCWTTR